MTSILRVQAKTNNRKRKIRNGRTFTIIWNDPSYLKANFCLTVDDKKEFLAYCTLIEKKFGVYYSDLGTGKSGIGKLVQQKQNIATNFNYLKPAYHNF